MLPILLEYWEFRYSIWWSELRLATGGQKISHTPSKVPMGNWEFWYTIWWSKLKLSIGQKNEATLLPRFLIRIVNFSIYSFAGVFKSNRPKFGTTYCRKGLEVCNVHTNLHFYLNGIYISEHYWNSLSKNSIRKAWVCATPSLNFAGNV